jgi:glucokinase
MKAKYACGVDIGGSHVTAALVDLEKNAVVELSVRRSKIDASRPANEIVSNWVSVIRESLLTQQEKNVNVGIAMPGPFDYEEGISYIKGQHKYDALYKVNLKNTLALALGQPPHSITFANDAACFLQGEVAGGIAKGCQNVMGFTLGTGFGSAWFTNGIAEDADHWHSPFLDGIAEDYLSTRWFLRRYRELSQKPMNDVKEMADFYYTDPAVRAVFEEFGINLGHFTRKILEGQEIEMVVLGGNIAQAIELFRPGIEKAMTGSLVVCSFAQSKLGEHAALLGAVSINTLITTL